MKKLSDLKRDIQVSAYIECIKIEEKMWNNNTQDHAGEWMDIPIHERMQGKRYVSFINTQGFFLKRPDDKSRIGSCCSWPKASELSYDGDVFTITEKTSKGTEWQRRTYKIIN